MEAIFAGKMLMRIAQHIRGAMASSEQNLRATMDPISMSEKKEMNVSVEPVPEPLSSKSPTEQVVPRDWPNEPGQLEVSRLYEFAMLMYDLFLCLLTLALVMKTTLCIISYKINHRRWEGILTSPVDMGSPLTSFLQILNAQIVTAFTIVFVTVMTTVTRRYALWKAQRGAYVSDLEQMCGSTSLPSTIKMVFVLRKFTLSSLALIALWSFYYLGSQASSREYVHAASGPRRLVQGAVPGDSVIFDFASPSVSQGGATSDIAWINEQYNVNGALNLQTGLDLRGFLLVPDMRTTFTTHNEIVRRTEDELHSWMTIETSILVPTDYTGFAGRKAYMDTNQLFGIPSESPGWNYIGTLDGTEGQGVFGEYLFTTSFINVECNPGQALSLENMPLSSTTTTNTSVILSSPADSTSSVSHSENFDIYYKYDEDAPKTVLNEKPGVIWVHCTINRPHVEIVATCPAGGCLAKKMRYLSTYASNPFENTTWSKGFLDNFLGSDGGASIGVTNISGVVNGTNLQYDFETYLWADSLSLNTPDQPTYYGDAFMLGFNTYFNLADVRTYNPEIDGSYQRVLMYIAEYSPQYRLIWAWVILDYVSTAILFMASIASLWLRKHTLAPDIFGYVSSLTRDNPHVPVVDGGSSLSGIDRARAMRRVKIRIADVGGEDGVGRIGVVYLHENATAQPLSKSRMYV